MEIVDAFRQMGIVALFSLVVGAAPAVMGAAYAIWPTEAKLALMRPLSLASIFAALAGFVAGVINILQFVSSQSIPLTSGNALVGFAESLVPLFVAFGSLTIAWLLVALGLRRTG